MSISLVKGQKIDLTKGNAGLRKVVFALGWDLNRYDGDAEFDLDVSAFFTDDSGKVTGEQDFVFYGQPQHPSGSLTYSYTSFLINSDQSFYKWQINHQRTQTQQH